MSRQRTEESLRDDLDLIAGLDAVAGAKPVEHAEALERVLGGGHAARQPLHRIAVRDGDNPDAQGLCRLDFGERQAPEARDRFAESAVSLGPDALGGEDEAVDVA